jgi:hypothetical protein
MSDVTVTSSTVVAGDDAVKESGTSGDTITAGDAVYKNSSNLWVRADADGEASAAAEGIAITTSSSGQPVTVVTAGTVEFGSGLTAGAVYGVSTNVGTIAPVADATTGDYRTVLGAASTTSKLHLGIVVTGYQI